MLSTRKIYVIRKEKFMKKNDKSDYWYKITYLYLDDKGEVEIESEFVDHDSYDQVTCSINGKMLEDFGGYVFKGHYQQFRFKADSLVE